MLPQLTKWRENQISKSFSKHDGITSTIQRYVTAFDECNCAVGCFSFKAMLRNLIEIASRVITDLCAFHRINSFNTSMYCMYTHSPQFYCNVSINWYFCGSIRSAQITSFSSTTSDSKDWFIIRAVTPCCIPRFCNSEETFLWSFTVFVIFRKPLKFGKFCVTFSRLPALFECFHDFRFFFSTRAMRKTDCVHDSIKTEIVSKYFW